ncbi:unnamed protein product [Polarella glacialis]|uniref:Uncharacterized protein n=1 Tax=Polarella glacialis TaxID=89957 RepID=A0A813KJZ9_POLGL|nr:unnamed protein product [Polarella glacialis]CAE8705812.1 unnamed protein product [Polarella glacialis]
MAVLVASCCRPRPLSCGRLCLLGLLLFWRLVALAVAWGAGVNAFITPGDAIRHYTKALRGAATVRQGSESRAFQRTAHLYYRAVMYRRTGDFQRAASIYEKEIGLQQRGILPRAEEVSASAAAAHAWLNLALTQQGQYNFDASRRSFQSGVSRVQELIQNEHHVWIDGQSRVRFSLGSSSEAYSESLSQALRWLATLLTAWGLLETKAHGLGRARLLVQRAATLDKSKGQVLRWRVVDPSQVHAQAL